MWTWFKSLFQRDDPALYRPRQRLIYHYLDGTKLVAADPMVLYKRVMEKAPDLWVNSKVAASISKDAGKAEEDTLRILRDIFGVKKLEEGGLSELETALLFNHFLSYCAQLKKNTRRSATSPAATLPPSASSWDANPPTENGSASGSTANAPPTAPPNPLPPAAASPAAASIQESNTSEPLATARARP